MRAGIGDGLSLLQQLLETRIAAQAGEVGFVPDGLGIGDSALDRDAWAKSSPNVHWRSALVVGRGMLYIRDYFCTS